MLFYEIPFGKIDSRLQIHNSEWRQRRRNKMLCNLSSSSCLFFNRGCKTASTEYGFWKSCFNLDQSVSCSWLQTWGLGQSTFNVQLKCFQQIQMSEFDFDFGPSVDTAAAERNTIKWKFPCWFWLYYFPNAATANAAERGKFHFEQSGQTTELDHSKSSKIPRAAVQMWFLPHAPTSDAEQVFQDVSKSNLQMLFFED